MKKEEKLEVEKELEIEEGEEREEGYGKYPFNKQNDKLALWKCYVTYKVRLVGSYRLDLFFV